MRKYPFDAHTRVALVDSIADLSAPRLYEIGVVVEDLWPDIWPDIWPGAWSWVNDITCDLTKDGLQLPNTTSSVRATPWAGVLDVERPTRYGYPGGLLRAFRYAVPEDGLWQRCSFKAERFIVVRRGVDVETAWAVGDKVEAYRVRLGNRSVLPSAGNAATTFTLPLFVQDVDDDATVVL